MKIRYLIGGLLLCALASTSCEKPDEFEIGSGENVAELVVRGRLADDPDKNNYNSVIDEAAGTITVQVPYYISDTEQIQGDLTQMKIYASMPIGARFEPGIAGIYDLSQGIERTLVRADGSRKSYTIKAVYAKSSAALVSRVSLTTLPNALVIVTEPETEGGDGMIQIYKTSSSVDVALTSAMLTVSPWATVESAGLRPDGTLDLSLFPDIYVIAQDGTRRKYTTSFVYPEYVDPGKAGYKSLLFAFQTTPDNPRGFVPTQNRTLAVVGNHLVISNTALDFLVFDRFSGEKLDNVRVNTTGLLSGFIHAITSDDAGHMVAISMAAVNNQWVANQMFEIYVWKNGITSAPEKVFSENILTSEAFAQFRSSNASVATTGTWDIGRTVSVKGDITGEAMLMTLANSVMNRLLRVRFEGGRSVSVTGTAWGLSAWNQQSKPIPLGLDVTCDWIMNGNNASGVVCYRSQNDNRQVDFSPRGNWWAGSPARLIGSDYIEFNGMKLLGLQNVTTGTVNGSANKVTYARLVVHDISSMVPTAFADSQVMDTRLDNYDPAFGPVGPGGNNSSLTGMTSYFGAIGNNGNSTGDVAFGATEDGNAVQVYMMTTDQGILAYEITRYDL